MKPGPNSAFRVLPKYLNVDSPPISAQELLHTIMLGEMWFDNDIAYEKAELWEKSFLKFIKDSVNELYKLGRHCPYAFNSSSGYFLQGAYFIEPQDSKELQKQKRSRSKHGIYLNSLRSLSPKTFEVLCKGILCLLGVRRPILTEYSGDQGIDFYGRLELEKQFNPSGEIKNFTKQMSVWLIGQAKHYINTTVSTIELRELVGSIELAKAKTFATVNQIHEDLDIKLCDPIYYLFFTTGTITVDSWRLTQRSGLISMDGEMIAAFLADNQIGIKNDEFSEANFQNWLDEVKKI